MIKVDSLSIYFNTNEGSRKILENINLKIDKGVYFLHGENGTGKTTFFKLITSELTPSLGKIEVNGKVFLNHGLNDYLSYKVSNYFKMLCFKRNIIPNSKFIESVKKNLFLTHIWNKKIFDLTNEEKQLVELCDLMFKDYDVVLLDEALSQVSLDKTKTIYEFLSGYYRECIIISIDHSNKIQFAPNFDLYITNNNIIKIENKHYEEISSIDSLVSYKRNVSKAKKYLINHKDMFIFNTLSCLFIIFSFLTSILTLRLNTLDLSSLNELQFITLRGDLEKIDKLNYQKMNFTFNNSRNLYHEDYMLSFSFSANGNVNVDNVIKYKYDERLDDDEASLINYFSSKENITEEIFLSYSNYVDFYDKDLDFDSPTPFISFTTYKPLKVKVNKELSTDIYIEKAPRFISLSPNVYNFIFTINEFFQSIHVLDENSEIYPRINFFMSDEKKVITSIPDVKSINFFDKNKDDVQSVEVEYDANITDLTYNNNCYLFSSAFIMDYIMSNADYITYRFSSLAEYKNIMSKANKFNLEVEEGYSFYLNRISQKENQNIYISSIIFFLSSAIIVLIHYYIFRRKKSNIRLTIILSAPIYLICSIILLILSPLAFLTSISIPLILTLYLLCVQRRGVSLCI